MTDNTETQGRKPDLIAYAVSKDGFFTRIGAAWKHKNSEGFNAVFAAYPANGHKLVFLPPKEKPEGKQLGDE
jgi:hypothetical protein